MILDEAGLRQRITPPSERRTPFRSRRRAMIELVQRLNWFIDRVGLRPYINSDNPVSQGRRWPKDEKTADQSKSTADRGNSSVAGGCLWPA